MANGREWVTRSDVVPSPIVGIKYPLKLLKRSKTQLLKAPICREGLT